MKDIYKYPRTPHIEGSAIQRGDEDVPVLPLSELIGKHLVVEEKMDGTNCAISFGKDGQMLLQSRGHYLIGGPRERQFHLFKTWAKSHEAELRAALGTRYVMYGEWLYAKQRLYYTRLPHYFMEFDIFDKVEDAFLSTEGRNLFLGRLPSIVSVRVIYMGKIKKLKDLTTLIERSPFISDDHLRHLRAVSVERGLDPDQVLRETDPSVMVEGLYIKVEEKGTVRKRYKYVRGGFVQKRALLKDQIEEREQLDPLVPNQLRAGVHIF